MVSCTVAVLDLLWFVADHVPRSPHHGSCVLWVPIDVVKERMQIQRVIKNVSSPAAVGSPPVFRNGWHAMSSIVKSEGVTGFYRVRWALLERMCLWLCEV